MTVTLLTGVDPATLRRRAFERADAVAGDNPGSVVVATSDTGVDVAAEDAWAATYDPLRVRVTDLDRLAGDAYERVVGPATRLDTQTRRQTIDRALRGVATAARLPEAYAHEREVRELLSELAAAGYEDPERVGQHVDAHLDDRTATVLRRVAETAARLRRASAPASYTLPEAYRTVCAADDPASLVDADVVVVSGGAELADNQLEFLKCLASQTTVVVTLPLAATPTRSEQSSPGGEQSSPGDEPSATDGVNAYVADIHDRLATVADDHHWIGEPVDSSERGDADTADPVDAADTADPVDAADTADTPTLAAAVGRTFTRTPTAADAVPSELSWHTAATPIREARATARRVRGQIAGGVSPDEIAVVAPELLSYRDRLVDGFDAVGVPVSDAGRPPLGQTRVGRGTLDLVDCCRSRPTTRDVARLASNPAVDLAVDGTEPDAGELLSLVERLPTDDMDRLREELGPDADAVVETLLGRVQAVRDAPRDETVEKLRTLLGDTLGIGDSGDADRSHESNVRREIDRTLAAVARVSNLDGDSETDSDGEEDPTDPLWRVADALDGRRVAAGGSQPGTVQIVGTQDAVGRSYDHLHVVGLTRAAFPPEDRRSRFFRRAFESLPSVTATDRQARARYQFGVLVGSSETVTLSHPEVVDGDERLPSPILTELARVTGLEPAGTDSTPSVANAGDLQRALAGHDESTRETALADAVETGAVSTATADAVRRGADCLAGRTAEGLGEYNAQLDATTVAALHDPEPLSPTGLRSYARCGFRHYADRVLDLPEEPEYPLEPTPLDRGSLVHDALERFFEELLAETGDGEGDPTVRSESVALADEERATLERRLLEAVETELATLDAPTDDTFGTRWLETLLAGLATPADNPYYGERHPHEGVDRGLFVRFLEEELDADDRVLAVEAPLDFAATDDGSDDVDRRGDDDHAIELEAPDGRTVTVRGRVDRVAVEIDGVEVDGSAAGVEITGRVHDYKTSDPTTKRTFDGIDFQLPVYTVATQEELARRYGDDLTSVDGAFYTVEPPTTVRRKRSLLGTIYRNGGDASAFEQFLDAELPERVADVAGSVTDGAFHTTTVDPETAGCDYCRFADVCGVRHHQRRERAETASDAGHYVPVTATPGSYYDTLGGEES